jgi:S-methylmethionine-dependent homocysteine/selenocysteine methylase
MLTRRKEWTLVLTEKHIAEIDFAMDKVQLAGLKMQAVTRNDFPLPTLGPLIETELRDPLEKGRGFSLLAGMPVERWGPDKSKLALWGIGSYIGVAEKQDAAGLMMHDVKDIAPKSESTDLMERMKQDKNIRGFQTNAALPYHTDGCDSVALACLSQGNRGGESLLISAPSIFNTILERRPDLCRVLQEPFHFDNRGQGKSQTQLCPIFTVHDGRVNALHKEPYILSAQRFEGVPKLTDLQQEALDVLRDVMESSGLAMRFTLQPGECLIGSNHSTLHGRTAFHNAPLDGSKENATRHMIRLWLTVEGGRHLPAHYEESREYADTFARRSKRKVVVDGSMGRLLLNNGLPSDGQLWSARALSDDKYHGHVVQAHAEYIRAGADVITTNNFAVQPGYYRKAFSESEWESKMIQHTRLSAQLAKKARDECGRPSVQVLGCLPPLIMAHRPDLTEDEYLREGQEFYDRMYKTIAKELNDDCDAFIAETLSTIQELLCAIRAGAAHGKPVHVAMAGALRDRRLQECPSRVRDIIEVVLQEAETGRANIPVLHFNCATPEAITRALEAIPESTHQRLRRAGIQLGAYPNLSRGAEKRQGAGFDVSKQKARNADGESISKIARRDDIDDTKLRSLCDAWTGRFGVTHVGGCCGSTPVDIKVIADHLAGVKVCKL